MRIFVCSLALLLLLQFSPGSAQFLRCASNRGDCCDRHQFCNFWSQRGECRVNPVWMLRNCQFSCQSCPSSNIFRPQRPRPGQDAPTASEGDASTRPDGELQPNINAPAGCRNVMAIEIETRQVFATSQIEARMVQIGCAESQVAGDCSVNMCYHKKYRSVDGTCNNLQHPVVGAAFTAFTRLEPSAYDDRVNALVGSVRRNRPSPRDVSTQLISNPRSIPGETNSLLMQFGQFLAHDITKNAFRAQCPKCAVAGPLCSPIQFNGGCIPFTRSFPVCGTGMNGRQREQLNENTAFIDGSAIYASEGVTQRSLRQGAMMRVEIINGRQFPPNNKRTQMSAGDDRSTIFIGLAAMHTSFVRLHNNLAARFINLNQHWNQDRVFQETRKVVGSIIQAITYQEFLPALIGPFNSRLVPPYNNYNADVNPGILNEFAGAAYRLHGMIQEDYPLLDSNFREVGRLAFKNGVGHIEQVLAGIDAIYRGFIATPARHPQRITTSVSRVDQGVGDMAMLNIQRGRDHGLPSYNTMRQLCQLKKVNSFDDWPEVPDSAVRRRVSQLYQSPDDVDLYVGGVLEEPVDGSFVGPTFACIIAEQFVRLRDGDRFYYENPDVFTPSQLESLKKVSLSWLLCETGDSMTRIVRNAFNIDRGQNAVDCSQLPGLDVNPWRE